MATTHSQPEMKAATEAGPIPALRGAGWKWGTGLLMAYVIYGAFFIAQGVVGFGKSGDAARIVFFHVPVAILSSVAYIVASVYAFRFLANPRSAELDRKSTVAMELGLLFAILATVTGSLFAGVQWGSFWNWDPRETSIVGLLLLYASYAVLRGATAERSDRQGRLSAVYVLVTLVPALFLIFVVPRLPALGSLHPGNTLTETRNTSPTYKAVLYPAFLAFSMLFVWLFQLRLRFLNLRERRKT